MNDTTSMEFIGVTTSQSSILQLFPRWAAALDLGNSRLIGRDLPLNAEPAQYRDAIRHIATSSDIGGALVTSHKTGVYAAAGELFDELDRYAHLCREISCISKRSGHLVGHAKDPVTAGRTLTNMLGERFANPDRHVLCLGAGGAGLAIVVHLLERSAPPTHITVTDTSAERLNEIRRIHQQLDPKGHVSLEAAPITGAADQLLGRMPTSALVINATGMGKDLPGSPITDVARFPHHALVWDLNYRGELYFLRQARRQAGQAQLTIQDGWTYFLHGWSEHIAEIFDLQLTDQVFKRLQMVAEDPP